MPSKTRCLSFATALAGYLLSATAQAQTAPPGAEAKPPDVGGFNIGAYWSDTNANSSAYTIAGRNIAKSTGTVFIQKTF